MDGTTLFAAIMIFCLFQQAAAEHPGLEGGEGKEGGREGAGLVLRPGWTKGYRWIDKNIW